MDYEAHFKMCYMVTKFAKRILRTTRRPIRIKKNNTEIFICVENPVKRRKYPVRISTYVI
jgi:hypothetical protein